LAKGTSAEKRARRADRRRLRNRSVRSDTKTRVRQALPLIADRRTEEAEVAVRRAVSALDKAAKKGVIHPNNAARRKSRLVLKYNAALAAVPAPEEEAPPKKRARRSKKEAAPAPAPKATRRPRKGKD
jgi:small subunit ribosomal protein S20